MDLPITPAMQVRAGICQFSIKNEDDQEDRFSENVQDSWTRWAISFFEDGDEELTSELTKLGINLGKRTDY